MINKGFTKANSTQPSSETRKDVQPHLVYDQNRALTDNDGFNVETFKAVIPDIHTMNKEQKCLTDDIASYHRKCVIDIEKNKDDCESQEDSRRFSSLRKSLDWNSDLCHGAGKCLCLIYQFSLLDPQFLILCALSNLIYIGVHVIVVNMKMILYIFDAQVC